MKLRNGCQQCYTYITFSLTKTIYSFHDIKNKIFSTFFTWVDRQFLLKQCRRIVTRYTKRCVVLESFQCRTGRVPRLEEWDHFNFRLPATFALSVSQWPNSVLENFGHFIGPPVDAEGERKTRVAMPGGRVRGDSHPHPRSKLTPRQLKADCWRFIMQVHYIYIVA